MSFLLMTLSAGGRKGGVAWFLGITAMLRCCGSREVRYFVSNALYGRAMGRCAGTCFRRSASVKVRASGSWPATKDTKD
jgi:hypothetical protein